MAENPRGFGGCVLDPGTVVRIHGLKSTLGRTQNGKEGVCEFWEPMRGEMHVRFADDPQTHAYSPNNLQKVVQGEKDIEPTKEEEDTGLSVEAEKILKIFMKFDEDGDGVLDSTELAHILESIGLPATSVPAFLAAMDKDGDKHVSYEEFVRWALAKNVKSGKRRCEAMWPEQPQQKPATRNSRKSIHELRELPDQLKEQADVADFSPSEDEDELTEEELIEQVGQLPQGWPEHGLKIVNNMRTRFPEYPLGGVLFLMKKHDYIGGNVIRGIRLTGAREVENTTTSIIKVGAPGAFPARYRNTCPDCGGVMNVYKQGCEGFSYRNMRDGKLTPVRTIAHGAIFEVLEVRRSAEYGFCFGRVADAMNGKSNPHWVVLGIELGETLSFGQTLSTVTSAVNDYEYTNAERVDKSVIIT